MVHIIVCNQAQNNDETRLKNVADERSPSQRQHTLDEGLNGHPVLCVSWRRGELNSHAPHIKAAADGSKAAEREGGSCDGGTKREATADNGMEGSGGGERRR